MIAGILCSSPGAPGIRTESPAMRAPVRPVCVRVCSFSFLLQFVFCQLRFHSNQTKKNILEVLRLEFLKGRTPCASRFASSQSAPWVSLLLWSRLIPLRWQRLPAFRTPLLFCLATFWISFHQFLSCDITIILFLLCFVNTKIAFFQSFLCFGLY